MGAVAVAAVLAAAVPSARAGIEIVDQSVRVDLPGGIAAFAARFSEEPDLFTKDEFGRLADSFQYEIDADGPVSGETIVGGLEAVVRGDEIHLANALRVRAAGDDVTPDPDPVAGGWGPVRTEIPFDLDGEDLFFEVSLAALGDDDGQFSYRVFTTEFGLTTSQVEAATGPSVVIPLPPAAWGALASLCAIAVATTVRRRRR